MNKKTLIVLFVLLLIPLATFAGWRFYRAQVIKSIDSFEKCATAGFPILESYPAQCVANGKTFVQEISEEFYLEPEEEKEEGPLPEVLTVKVFFSSQTKDPQAMYCERTYPVERQIPRTQAIGRATLEELLAGPTEEEGVAGYFTNINEGVRIKNLTIENGVAKVDFDETMDEGIGGSCRVTAIRSQITETLMQFTTVSEVQISVNGKTEDILQP